MGHVNNAAYVRYLLECGTAEGAQEGIRRLSIEYHASATKGDALELYAWPVGVADGLLTTGYRLVSGHDGAAVVSAEAGRQPQSYARPADAAGPRAVKPFPLPVDSSAYRYRRRRPVAEDDVDKSGRVRPSAYFEWLQEATIGAAESVDWPLERIAGAGSVIIQYRHDAEFPAEAMAGQTVPPGDEVEVISRLIDTRRAWDLTTRHRPRV